MLFGEDLNVGVGNRTGDTGLKYSMTGDNIRQKFTGYQKDNETQLDFAEGVIEQKSRFGTDDAFERCLILSPVFAGSVADVDRRTARQSRRRTAIRRSPGERRIEN